MRRFSVVIPYYQSRAGILRSALQSVFAQRLDPGDGIRIVVVDDGSPRPAALDLQDLAPPVGIELVVLSQPNAGVAEARNRGLAEGESWSDFTAFLDSDDVWDPSHLAEAAAALEGGEGADFYCCDNGREGHHESYFDLLRLRAVLAEMAPGAQDASLVRVPDARAFSLVLRSVVAQTSCVVYRSRVGVGLRFNAGLKGAGEDHLFWLELLTRSPRMVISFARNVACGTGVNIYFSHLGWDSPKVLERIGDRLRSFDAMQQQFALGEADSAHVAQKRGELRRLFVYLAMRALAKRIPQTGQSLARMRRMDRDFPRWGMAAMAGLIWRRVARGETPREV